MLDLTFIIGHWIFYFYMYCKNPNGDENSIHTLPSQFLGLLNHVIAERKTHSEAIFISLIDWLIYLLIYFFLSFFCKLFANTKDRLLSRRSSRKVASRTDGLRLKDIIWRLFPLRIIFKLFANPKFGMDYWKTCQSWKMSDRWWIRWIASFCSWSTYSPILITSQPDDEFDIRWVPNMNITKVTRQSARLRTVREA